MTYTDVLGTEIVIYKNIVFVILKCCKYFTLVKYAPKAYW